MTRDDDKSGDRDRERERDGAGDRERPASAASPMSAPTTLSREDEAIVAAYNTVLEAELARGRLESEGINCRIQDGNTVGIAHHLSLAVGGAKIVVAQSDFEEARAILSSVGVESGELDDDDDEDDVSSSSSAEPTADELANKALRSAIIGLVLLPPIGHVWSLTLASGALRKSAELTDKGKRDAIIAVLVDGVVLAIFAWVVSRVL